MTANIVVESGQVIKSTAGGNYERLLVRWTFGEFTYTFYVTISLSEKKQASGMHGGKILSFAVECENKTIILFDGGAFHDTGYDDIDGRTQARALDITSYFISNFN